MSESDVGSRSDESAGSWIALIFVGFTLLLGALFTLYVLLWDGGGHFAR
jgi:hypothetical protein